MPELAGLESLEVALGAAVLLLGGLVFETRVLPGLWVPVYNDIGLPLLVSLPPIADRPTGRGDTPSVAWVAHGRRVRFAGRPRERRVPVGLHGTVRFHDVAGGRQMRVSWSPPWTLFAAMVWAALIAVSRGEGAFMVPILIGLGAVVGGLYWSQARRVAVELRMAFSRRTTPDDAPGRG
ncbi:MAG: hypothetical protein AAF211_00965 [Myxococcota bacterium]